MSSRAQRKAQNLAQRSAQGLPPPKAQLTREQAAAAKQASAARAKSPTEQVGDRVVEATFEAGATQLDQFPPPAFSEIAFAGRSNVGKSSLMNCLTSRRNLVRTSSTPGCTRQVAWFRTTSDDKSIIDLVDLPGYGYAKRSKSERGHWADLIESYLLERPTLRGVVLLIDIRRGIEADDLDLLEMLNAPPRTSRRPLEVLIAATKMDKLSPAQQKSALLKLSQKVSNTVYAFSSVTAQGRVPLWRRLRAIAGVGEMIKDEESTLVAPGP